LVNLEITAYSILRSTTLTQAPLRFAPTIEALSQMANLLCMCRLLDVRLQGILPVYISSTTRVAFSLLNLKGQVFTMLTALGIISINMLVMSHIVNSQPF